ncbi:hypothetical protein VE03_07903 [Pseudogymnoascus sp. 23342-1-I1]|nr:hypothetical protein VE03_07903 [Pseudogymnoascus sp. 23342-1-I1]
MSSVELVQQFLLQIKQHDPYLKAVLAISPVALEEARRLDVERQEGKIRGPLHGIPIIIKDNIATDPRLGMDTTAGSFALVDSKPKQNAEVIEKLIKSGAIILAKTNLSEFAFYKGTGLPSGWSALGGQTQSAYTRGDVIRGDGFLGHSSPAGSSSGSAVGVSAGYAPISLGTDTTGSVVLPATRAALYALRLTQETAPMKGIIPISNSFDSLGPMAKCVQDLANVLDVIIDPSTSGVPAEGFNSSLPQSWSKLRVGVLDPEVWYLTARSCKPNQKAHAQMVRETKAAYDKIRTLALSFKEVKLLNPDEVTQEDGKGLTELFEADFRNDINSYLFDLETSNIRSLASILEFNQKARERELPPDYPQQDLLVNAQNNNLTSEERDSIFEAVRRISRKQAIDETLETNKIDVIVGPADSSFSLLACASGYPSAVMPLSYLDFNGRPFGLFALTSAHGEHLLLQVLSAFEHTFPERKPPSCF